MVSRLAATFERVAVGRDLREKVAGVPLDQARELVLIRALQEVAVIVDNCVHEFLIRAWFDPAIDPPLMSNVQILRHLPVLRQLASAAFVELHLHYRTIVHDVESLSEVVSLDSFEIWSRLLRLMMLLVLN